MSRRLMYLVCVALVGLLLGTAAQAARDITQPGDKTVAIPNNGNWPANEQVNQAIDNQIVTKYLHFNGATEPTGFTVTPSAGPTVVTGINLCSANDAVERDPVKYELSGSNDSIDGPWTLISSGDIKEWAGAAPARRVWLTKPISFVNTVSYKHYKLMFPVCRGPGQNSMQIAEVEFLSDVYVATMPNPANGATGIVMPLLQWVPGDTATFVDIYVGTTPELSAADKFTRLPASVKLTYYTKPVASGQKLYWRIDCVDKSNKVYAGDVWSFTMQPLIAYSPTPMDGDKWISTSTNLSWLPGQNAMRHKLYFGTDKTAVTNRAASVFQGELVPPSFELPDLAENTAYYWVVDEILTAGEKAGDVWVFTTVGPGGGVKGEYFSNTALSGLPVLTRIDKEINVTAAIGAPVPDSGWSARWTADLEITQSGTYNFALNCHAYTRMSIDGKLIIDKWEVPGVGGATVISKYFSLPVTLEKGIHPVVVEYICSGTYAETLTWWTATMAEVIVPAGPLQPPVRARALYPANGDVNVPQDVTLTWSAGEKAAKHNVYFGDDEAAVAAADTASSLFKGQQTEASFDVGKLEWNKTYYWRIDEVNDAETGSPWSSSVWKFTTADFLVVDNMETYNDAEGTGTRIYETWIDGYTDGQSGSTVGNMDPPFAERTVVHGGVQSMPIDYNNINTPYFSHVYREFAPVQDWTVNGVTDLVLWVRGYPAAMAPVTETGGKMTVTAEGSDIWNNGDQFTFVYKTLSGDGSLVARVTSNGTGTDTWAKGGVMIRDGLDAGSTHAMMVATGGGGNGASFQYRLVADSASANSDAAAAIALPYYVKIERKGDTLTGSTSPDGTTWTVVGSGQYIAMTAPAYIGVCVTSHVAGANRTFVFDNIKATGAGAAAWQTKEIGLSRNGTAPLYVIVEESPTKKATVANPDAGIINATQWTEWRIPLSQFTGVNVKKVKKLYIGVGNEASPTAGGAGRIFIDDIRVMKPVGQ